MKQPGLVWDNNGEFFHRALTAAPAVVRSAGVSTKPLHLAKRSRSAAGDADHHGAIFTDVLLDLEATGTGVVTA